MFITSSLEAVPQSKAFQQVLKVPIDLADPASDKQDHLSIKECYSLSPSPTMQKECQGCLSATIATNNIQGATIGWLEVSIIVLINLASL